MYTRPFSSTFRKRWPNFASYNLSAKLCLMDIITGLSMTWTAFWLYEKYWKSFNVKLN